MNLGIDSSNQQLNKNKVVFLDKARIALDALQNDEQAKVMHVINCLEEFPNSSLVKINQLKSIPNYFIARSGIYRIIFEFKPEQITIVDIVNRNRLEMLYSSLA
ncbi:hypothetical protein BV372_04135 [Nostoc sp. T09]|uniref:type II toxin-antitoxin system RelE family toxin n=1 Tax=Nostoc sp. T09 TaxID=1932621 RepID=UPI000A3CBC3E|nr:hypothetical protein [Nostoc sp. T09]OUL37084.1 hypothetical protein BV372_04135 [Nostoc sp. T09]